MSTIRATILIGVLSLLSKILGAARQGFFANRFGAGAEADIYIAAFRVPDLLFNLLILGTLSVAFIPVFVQYMGRGGKKVVIINSVMLKEGDKVGNLAVGKISDKGAQVFIDGTEYELNLPEEAK